MSEHRNMLERARYAHKKANGLCVICGKKSATRMCDLCRMNLRDTVALRYEHCLSIGVCTRCHQPLKEGEHLVCNNCREIYKELQKQRYYSRKSNGICVRCGKHKVTKGCVCDWCKAKRSQAC